MSQQLMTMPQESTPSALWPLAAGEALRLDIGPGQRELHVTAGRVWLTREGSAQAPAEDIWLAAGDSVTLASGSEWVLEGWGAARFQLLVPPQACATMRRRLGAPAWQQAAGSALAPALG
jgi:hypothetical protein